MKALLYIETKDGHPIGTSLELFSAAGALDADMTAILIGKTPEDAAKETAAYGVETVFIDTAEEPSEDLLTDALVQAAEKYGADIVLLSATTTGKLITPRIAARLQAGSVNDAISVAADGGRISAVRPVYGGTVREQIEIRTVQGVISVRGGSYAKPEGEASSAEAPESADITIDETKLLTKITEVIEEAGEAVNLEDAKIIVSGGRGMGSEEDFGLCEELAEVLGGVVGATRPAIENGWINRTHQVGQSGKIVAPDLYIACGVSGATQHLSGMTGSKYIVAVNKDADAPIFSVADVGIVGDVKQILPLMIEEIRKKKAQG